MGPGKGIVFLNKQDASGWVTAIDLPHFCSAGVGKRMQPSPTLNREGWKMLHCECMRVYMCLCVVLGARAGKGPVCKTTLRNRKHFPLRNRITARGILTQPEKWVVTPSFSLVQQRGLFFKWKLSAWKTIEFPGLCLEVRCSLLQ